MHGQQPPARGPAQREEQHDALLGQEGVGGVAVQAVDLQVGQDEGLGVGAALERDPGDAAYGAAGAVAADQVAGSDLLGPAVSGGAGCR